MRIFAAIRKWFHKIIRKPFRVCSNDVISNISYYPSTFPTTVKDELVKTMQVLKETEQTVNEKELTVAVVGDFSVGKSTFISALIGKDVLPISAKPTTALVTKIRYGKREEAIVKYRDKEVKMSCQEYMRFSSYSMEDLKVLDSNKCVRRLEGITEAVVYVNSPFLKKHNICIIDTLGLNATEHDTQQTKSAINGAIAVIYVCKERGLSSNDLDFMSKNLNMLGDNLFVCINQSDMVSKREREEVTSTVSLKINYLLKPGNKCFPTNRVYSLSSRYERFAQKIISDEEREFYNDSLDYKNRSGFLSLRKNLVEYLNLNCLKARVSYAQTQYAHIIAKITIIAEQRCRELESSIMQYDHKISATNKRIEDYRSQIELIQGNFNNLREHIKGQYIDFYQQCETKINKTWSIDFNSLVKCISFNNHNYVEWARVEDKLFWSKEKKLDAMRSIFAPFVEIMIEYLNKKIIIIANSVIQQISILCNDFYEKYRYEKPPTVIEVKNIRSLIIDKPNVKESFSRDITIALQLFLQNERGLFSVMSARVRNFFDRTSNNSKRVESMLEETKKRSLVFLAEHIRLCIIEIQEQLSVAINELIKHATRSLRIRIETMNCEMLEMKKQQQYLYACKETEREYFTKIGDLLHEEKFKVDRFEQNIESNIIANIT